MNGDKVGELMSERSLIDSALVQWKKDYLVMETDLKEKNRNIKDFEASDNQLLLISQKLTICSLCLLFKDKVSRQSKDIVQLQETLKSSNTEMEKMKEGHEKDIEDLHKQYEMALQKQREATSTAAVDIEKVKARKLQEKISELGIQMSDFERQQAVDTAQLRDQLKQKESEVKRAKAEAEELRRIQDKAMEDKENLLAEVNKTVDQLSSERLKLEYALGETKVGSLQVNRILSIIRIIYTSGSN